MKQIINLTEKVARVWALCGGLLILSIMAVTSVNVIGFGLDRVARQFGENVSGLPGYEDYVRLAISMAALMFLPYCQLRRGHVAVDLFVKALPFSVRKGLDFLWLVATVLLSFFLAYWMARGMVETFEDNALSRVLGWAEWPFYLPGILSLVLWGLTGLVQIVGGNADD